MKKTTLTLALFFGLLFFGSTSLFAQDSESPLLTFTVPVELHNMMPKAKAVRIRVYLQDAEGRTVVDKKSEAVEIPENGNFPRTIFTVEFYGSDGPIVPQVTQYRCELYICQKSNGAGDYPAQPAGETNEMLQYCTAKAGTPFVGSVTGPIEW